MHDQGKLQIQMYLSIMLVISSLIHLFIGLYFVYLNSYFLAALSVVDLFVYVIAFFINKAGKTRLASFVFVFKILSYSVISTFLLGINVNVHWFILIAILPTALYLNFTKRQKSCILAAMPFLINLQLLLPKIYPPPFNMDGNTFLKFFFANILVVGLMVGFILNNVITRRLADSYAKDIKDFEDMSNLDPLTRLNNRRYADQFFEMLNNSAMNIPCLFCLIDIDNFKSINDTYGHDAGDIVLMIVADILRQNTRQSDLVCRWGGEEFLVGFQNCELKIGRDILEKMRKSIEDEVINTESGKIKVTITGGASILANSNIKATLENCDKKLYEGKRSGKNKIVL